MPNNRRGKSICAFIKAYWRQWLMIQGKKKKKKYIYIYIYIYTVYI